MRSLLLKPLKHQNLNPDIMELVEAVLVSKFKNLSREEIEAMFALSDIKNTRVYIKNTRVYKDALREGELTGLHRGLRKGLLKGRQEIALNLLKSGMDIEQVAQVTGLKVEQVRQLQS